MENVGGPDRCSGMRAGSAPLAPPGRQAGALILHNAANASRGSGSVTKYTTVVQNAPKTARTREFVSKGRDDALGPDNAPGPTTNTKPEPSPAQIVSGSIWIAPHGHSWAHSPQPLQKS